MGCTPTPVTPTCCAEWGCRSELCAPAIADRSLFEELADRQVNERNRDITPAISQIPASNSECRENQLHDPARGATSVTAPGACLYWFLQEQTFHGFVDCLLLQTIAPADDWLRTVVTHNSTNATPDAAS
jgi:hypothetical protein